MRGCRLWLLVVACALLPSTDAWTAEESPDAPASPSAPSDWEVQGDWLVDATHRCQLRKPAAEGWDFLRDATAGWVVAYRAPDDAPQATIEVLCEVRDEAAAPRQMARAALDHAYGRQGEAHYFLPQARSQQRQVTFQGAGAMRLRIEGPYSTGVWHTDTYLIFRRKQLLVILHATATPQEAYKAQQAAIESIFNSLTWF